MPKQFQKKARTHKELVSLLIERGLICQNIDRILRHLEHVSYYRLSGYARELMLNPSDDNPIFKTGTTYEDIWNIYTFDRELRTLTLDALERIEVSIRTVLSDTMSLKYGPHWFMDKNLFVGVENINKKLTSYQCFINAIQKDTGKVEITRRTLPTEHYYSTYESPELPPSWIVFESLSMGKWTIVLDILKNSADKVNIFRVYNMPNNALFTSWIKTLTEVRNIVAHHGILWNRRLKNKPMTPASRFNVSIPKFNSVFLQNAEYNVKNKGNDTNTYYAVACIIVYFLKIISPNSTWSTRLKDLFDKYHSIDIQRMGFSVSWWEDSFWAMCNGECTISN